jgi:hypothetical protein
MVTTAPLPEPIPSNHQLILSWLADLRIGTPIRSAALRITRNSRAWSVNLEASTNPESFFYPEPNVIKPCDELLTTKVLPYAKIIDLHIMEIWLPNGPKKIWSFQLLPSTKEEFEKYMQVPHIKQAVGATQGAGFYSPPGYVMPIQTAVTRGPGPVLPDPDAGQLHQPDTRDSALTSKDWAIARHIYKSSHSFLPAKKILRNIATRVSSIRAEIAAKTVSRTKEKRVVNQDEDKDHWTNFSPKVNRLWRKVSKNSKNKDLSLNAQPTSKKSVTPEIDQPKIDVESTPPQGDYSNTPPPLTYHPIITKETHSGKVTLTTLVAACELLNYKGKPLPFHLYYYLNSSGLYPRDSTELKQMISEMETLLGVNHQALDYLKIEPPPSGDRVISIGPTTMTFNDIIPLCQ